MNIYMITYDGDSWWVLAEDAAHAERTWKEVEAQEQGVQPAEIDNPESITLIAGAHDVILERLATGYDLSIRALQVKLRTVAAVFQVRAQEPKALSEDVLALEYLIKGAARDLVSLANDLEDCRRLKIRPDVPRETLPQGAESEGGDFIPSNISERLKRALGISADPPDKTVPNCPCMVVPKDPPSRADQIDAALDRIQEGKPPEVTAEFLRSLLHTIQDYLDRLDPAIEPSERRLPSLEELHALFRSIEAALLFLVDRQKDTPALFSRAGAIEELLDRGYKVRLEPPKKVEREEAPEK